MSEEGFVTRLRATGLRSVLRAQCRYRTTDADEPQLRQTPDLLQALLYTSGRTALRLYARLMLKVDVTWQAPLPPGPKLVVANHPSCSDPFFLALLFPQPVSLLVTEKAFAFPFFGAFLRRLGHIPVLLDNGRAAFDAARQLLEMGQPVALFPEGWVSPQQGGFHSPRTGAARLALLTGAPVIPIGIYLPRERNLVITSQATGEHTVGYWYLRGPYNMTVGSAMHFEGCVDDWVHVAAVSHNIMQRVISLASESEQRATL